MASLNDPAGTSWPVSFLQGYVRSVRGERLTYHSPEPGVESSLLVRSLDAGQEIAWETERLPETVPSSRVSFLWLFGIDVNPDRHLFELFLNGAPVLSFTNPASTEPRTWSVTGREGAELAFRSTLVDKYDDLMGYAVLTVPASLLLPGQPQVLSIRGETAGSRTWYMTFEARVEEGCLVRPLDLLSRHEGQLRRTVLFEFTRVGEAATGTIAVTPGPGSSAAAVPPAAPIAQIVTPFTLSPGHNAIPVELPEVAAETEISAEICVEGEQPRSLSFTVRPARRWTVLLVQHTHTDIGYTRPQAEILADHLRFLDQALDLCDRTDDLPEPARFRWTCETAWAVREFLRRRPAAQVERLRRRVREGRIEVTALFLNLSDALDEQAAARQLAPLREFRAHGLPVRAAMQSDINGVPWCLVDQLRSAGVEYLLMAQNTHRALKPFDRPTLFQWESPSGNRILVHAGDHYMQGNTIGLLGADARSFRDTLLRHLDRLASRGYERETLPVQFSGYFTDNSPPTMAACARVREWNETYEWPRLRLATASGALDELVRTSEAEPPVHRGAWPDWWMDGFGSAPHATAAARTGVGDLLAAEGLLAMARLAGEAVPSASIERMDAVGEQFLFHAEHTFGAAESISDPECANSVVQWEQKSSFAWGGVIQNRLLAEEALGLLDQVVPADAGPTLTVYNPLGWDRSGPCEVYLDHRTVPLDGSTRFVDEAGRIAAMQPGESREDGTWWTIWADAVPACGYRVYRLRHDATATGQPPARVARPIAGGAGTAVLESRFHEVTADTARGGVVRLLDRSAGCDLRDPASPWAMGHVIHERLENRHQLEGFRLDAFRRDGWGDLRVEAGTDGPVWRSLVLRGSLPGSADEQGVRCEIRLYEEANLVEFRYTLRKLAVTDPEAIYVAFPFAPAFAGLAWECQGAIVRPGLDQLAGSASDWVGIQGFVAARGRESQVVWSSPEIPLVQLGGLNLGQYRRVAEASDPHVFSWVQNNYWTTNFRAAESGELRWRYRVTSSRDLSPAFASRVGLEAKVPLVGRLRLGVGASTRLDGPSYRATQSFLAFLPGSVVPVEIRPSRDGRGLVCSLREVNGTPARINREELGAARPILEEIEVDPLEQPVRTIEGPVEFGPHQARSVLLVLDRG
jgi:hypothetical protein